MIGADKTRAEGYISRREVLRLGLGAALAASWGKGLHGEEPGMQRAIPSSGEWLPAVGLGTWQSFDIGDSAQAREGVRAVLVRFGERGGRVIDSSPMYGRAESAVGDLVHDLGLRRQLFLATKVWTSGRAAGVAQIEESCRRLKVDRLDLLQVHNLLDADTQLETLGEWKAAGRLRYLGVTHYHAGAFDSIERYLQSRRLDFVQFNYSMAEREAERRLLPVAQERGVAVIVNRPFAGRALIDRVRGKELPAWAVEIGCRTWAQFFLKFILAHPAVTCVIPATSNPKHLDDNMDAGRGTAPDASMRRRMVDHFAQL